MNESDDLLIFADEDHSSIPAPPCSPKNWRVLIADDVEEVHSITKLALGSLVIDGGKLTFDHAYDGAGARAKLAENDYALILLDVVMASQDDGLQVVRWLRQDQRDRITRVVLRTGQPGLAPEREVMLDYDINDYQPKSELTAQRLSTAVIGAIRSYRDLRIIEEQRIGLEKIVESTASLFELRSTGQLVSGVLQQLTASLGPAEGAMFFFGPDLETHEPVAPMILAATGCFEPYLGKSPYSALPADRQREINELIAQGHNGGGPGWSLFSMTRTSSTKSIPAAVYVESHAISDPWISRLLELFCKNAAVAFENQRSALEKQRLLDTWARFVPESLLQSPPH